MCDKVKDCGRLLGSSVNHLFQGREPWQIVAITTTTVLGTVWLFEFINNDERIISRGRRTFYRWLRKVPAVRHKVETAMTKQKGEFEAEIVKGTAGVSYTLQLPNESLSEAQILAKVDKHLDLGEYKWRDGRVSGAVYYFDPKLVELVQEVYGKASYSNPLHPDIFPGICKMEAEVVRMVANLFHGDRSVCGTMTTGGTESLILACKAYRDYARETKGITRPNIVMPVTAHAGFDKAAQYFCMTTKTVEMSPDGSCTVDVAAMECAITKNTVLLVASAPNFPYGTLDDVVAIGELGLKYNIPVHVDACLGGFLIVFMKRAGYPLPPFDFRVPGVTSISADTHKYGFAPKGSSVILYREQKYLHHQYTVTTDWPGGVYGSPTINGSRAGGVIAATWATMLRFGFDGYTEATKAIVDTAKYIEAGLSNLPGLFIYGTPATSVVALGSKQFDIYRLSGALSGLGWNLNNLQFPSGIHICITYMHTRAGVAERFLDDVREQLALIMKSPEKPAEGRMAIYGMAQSLSDRSLVGDITRQYLDSMYFTPNATS